MLLSKLPVAVKHAIVLGVLFPAASGCSGSGAHIEKVVPVAGTVTYKGQPLEGYQVTFMPADGRRPAIGVTDAAGKFTLGTNGPGDGAPPGLSNVAFVWVPPRTGELGQETITDNPDKLPKPKLRIPDKYTDPAKSGISQDVPTRGVTDLKFDLQ